MHYSLSAALRLTKAAASSDLGVISHSNGTGWLQKKSQRCSTSMSVQEKPKLT